MRTRTPPIRPLLSLMLLTLLAPLAAGASPASGQEPQPRGCEGVDVASFATSGNGTQASPFAGWSTAVRWSPNTAYCFRDKAGGGLTFYAFSAAPNWGKAYISLLGTNNTFLKYTGAGGANSAVADFNAESPNTPTGYAANIRMENFILDGGGLAEAGLDLRGIHHSYFRNVRVRNVTTYGLVCRWCVVDQFDGIKVNPANDQTGYVGALPEWKVRPQYGIYLTHGVRGVGHYTSALTFNAPLIEGVTVAGVRAVHASNCVFNSGTAEEAAGAGKGVVVDATAEEISFIGFDTENNGSARVDYEIAGDRNLVLGGRGNGSIAIQAGAHGNVVRAYRTQGAIAVAHGSNYTTVENVAAGSLDVSPTTNTVASNVFHVTNGTPLSAVMQNRQFAVVGGNGARIYIEAPGVVTEHQLTLPGAQGGADTFLMNDGRGQTRWGARMNYNATTNPGAADDTTRGYQVGSVWVNVSTDDAYIRVDSGAGGAVWKKMTP